MAEWEPTYQKNKAEWLQRQVEIDRKNAAASPGVTTKQLGPLIYSPWISAVANWHCSR
jgi:hypothetical protein